MTQKAGRLHDEVVVEMLKADTEFADAYLAAALEETDLPGGHQAMLTALRHIAEAQDMEKLACQDRRRNAQYPHVTTPL